MSKRLIPFAQPLITDEDRQAVMKVLRQDRLTDGLQVRAFEDKFAAFCEAPYAVAVNSCWSALYLSYLALGIGPGDSVICPALTHVATAHAIVRAGAQPVFVDCREGTADICSLSTLQRLQTATAICTLHYAGIPSGIQSGMVYVIPRGSFLPDGTPLTPTLVTIDKPIIADCALALGARWQNKGIANYATISCFSFYPSKHIACGEGGMVVCRDEKLAGEIRKLRAFGYDHSNGYDVTVLGGNFRMTEMQAVLGQGQLRRMAENLAWRGRRFRQLTELIVSAGLGTVVTACCPDDISAYYCCTVILPDAVRAKRNRIQQLLLAAGIETSCYYPRIVPSLAYYRDQVGYQEGQFPNAELIASGSIAFPCAPHVSAEDIEYMAETFGKVIEEVRSER